MKQSEIGKVTTFEKFAWDNDKGKLVIKISLKAIENPLLLYVEFAENSEKFVLGEEKAVQQIEENSDYLTKHKGALLMISEDRPLGSLLMDSYDFITYGLQGTENIFRSMLHSIDSGNSEKASDYKMLQKLWQAGNAFQQIVINYFFCKFYQVKYLAANRTVGIFAYTTERRQEMYSNLEQSLDQEFWLLKKNPTTLSDLKVLHIYNKDQTADKFIWSTFTEFYAKYIPYLSEKIFSLGYALAVASRSMPTLRGGVIIASALSCKIRTTSSAAKIPLNKTTFISNTKRNDTATIIFGGVGLLNVGAKNSKPSTLHFLRNSKRSCQNRKRNCKVIMRWRVGRRSIIGWRKLSVSEKTLKKNSNLWLDKKIHAP